MSTFKVTAEIIGNVEPAKNSDFLDLVSLQGKDYDFITQKGLYTESDCVIYFPIDSLLPAWIVEALGMDGKLAHGKTPEDNSERLRNRVKTIKLRGNLSQGIVCKPEILIEAKKDDPVFNKKALTEAKSSQGLDVTGDLGVEHYQPPAISSKAGNLVKMPHWVSTYKIERSQNYTRIADLLMDQPVFISEKVEGSNWWASFTKGGDFIVGQRNYAIEQQADKIHDWHKVATMYDIKSTLNNIFTELCSSSPDDNIQNITLRGEIIGGGIQGNYYNTPDHQIHLFDLEVNQRPVDASTFLDLMNQHGLTSVPVISRDITLREWLGDKSLKDASNGKSFLSPQRKREGIVIKPMRNLPDDEEIGRVFVKMPSPEYLAKSKH